MEEMWKPIIGFEGKYEISNLGRVKSLPRYKQPIERILIPCVSTEYACVNLRDGKKGHTKHIHRLIADHFIQNPSNKSTVNHKDGDKHNNSIENLEWASYGENNVHALNAKLRKPRAGGVSVIAIKDLVILEFDTIRQCANAFGVAIRTVRQAIHHPCKCKGHNIYMV